MVADIKYGSIFWDILFTDCGDGYAGQKEDAAEGPVDDGKRTPVLSRTVIFSEEVLCDQKGNTENQEQDNEDGN